MTDTSTRNRIQVSTASTVGPYIHVPFSQLTDICQLLDNHRLRYRVGENVFSYNGGPETITINFTSTENPSAIQAILDSVH